MYYNDFLNKDFTERTLVGFYGREFLAYSDVRKAEYNIYPLVIERKYEYNRYTHTLGAFEYTLEDEVYYKSRPIVEMTGAAADNGIAAARNVVLREVEARLSVEDTYVGQALRAGHNISAELSAYIAELEALPDGDVAALAYSLESESSLWPSSPTNKLDPTDLTLPISAYTRAEVNAMVGSIETETNADIAFRQIILSYQVKGDYPAKVSAIDDAVATYGENAPVETLYSHAVNILNA